MRELIHGLCSILPYGHRHRPRSDCERDIIQRGQRLLIRCSNTKCIFAHAIPCKGVDEERHVIDLLCNDVAWLGHSRVILKTDGEPAILAVAKQALSALRFRVEAMESASSETSQPYDSQANGAVESGIRNLRKDFRTLMFLTEGRQRGVQEHLRP